MNNKHFYRVISKLTVQLKGDLWLYFHAITTVVLVAHLTVKFFGTSGERTSRRKK